jgi:hypothetical protein
VAFGFVVRKGKGTGPGKQPAAAFFSYDVFCGIKVRANGVNLFCLSAITCFSEIIVTFFGNQGTFSLEILTYWGPIATFLKKLAYGVA